MENDKTPTYQVGQEVWWVNTLRHIPDPREADIKSATIETVGRKWATLKGCYTSKRFDVKTGQLDGNGFSSPGNVYVSKEAYRQEAALKFAWSLFKHDLLRMHQDLPPEGVTIEYLEEVSRRLNPKPNL